MNSIDATKAVPQSHPSSGKDPRALVLGIESSCDETAAAVVRGGKEILSSVIESQVEEHAVFGGVVPEIACRSHLRAVLPVIDQALVEAGVGLEQLSGIAVTNRPGLVGSLLVGLSAAKGLAFAQGLPLACVDHIEAHIYAATMEHEDISYPCVALVVSGGHTSLFEARSPSEIVELGSTLDDAAGEAFDKVAHLLGLSYPGGPSVSALASSGDPKAIRFPRYRPKAPALDFSFSGLKTAVLYHLRGHDALAVTPHPSEIQNAPDLAASFQEAVVDALVSNLIKASEATGFQTLLVAGGVACNARLREVLSQIGDERGLRVLLPSPVYCTDNAAMIAGLGWHLLGNEKGVNFSADASPRRIRP